MDALTADLVLVGCGHAHVQVLRRWMMAPMAGVRLSLVVDRPDAVYSGMVPGFVAGDYAAGELEIDGVPLARRAGARVVIAAALSIDARARRIELEGRPPLAYDVASLDVGATVRGLDLPGVREHALATRPIGRFVSALDARVEELSDAPRVAVVGGGAAGVELAFTLEARLRAAGRRPEVRIVAAGEDVLEGQPHRVRRLARRLLESRGIGVRTGALVERVLGDGLEIGGETLPADLVVWATGAAPLPFPRGPGLPLDDAGFVRVGPTLAVEGFPDLFAAGDCASLPFAPWVRKAGVYAVRGGPFLDANLRARLRGGRPRHYTPQRDFLTLLNLGDGEALGAKWGVALRGKRVWRLKDWIDRRFMRRFQVLAAGGAPADGFPSAESMGMEEMPCGGCAAKVGASALDAALARLPKAPADASVRIGLGERDDAALLQLPNGERLLATIDAFRAFTDDPFWVGRVAAVNAVSDVLAKGGRARHALALVNVPEEDPSRAEETLFQVLSGVRAALDPLGVSLVGGHTTQGGELYVGLSVTGDLEGEPLPAAGLVAGDRLILSKALGSGVMLAADMRGLLRGADLVSLLSGLARSNAEAARVASEAGASACTDVSGFGLAGHAAELLRAGGVSARFFMGAIPAWPAARALLARGVRSSFHEQNARGRRGIAVASGVDPDHEALLFDPQTSGGLLFGVAAGRAAEALAALHAAGDADAAVVGVVEPMRPDGALFEVVAGPLSVPA
jgi:selenide,water dikinase